MSTQVYQGIIDPEWTLEDLDPATWRAIGSFIDPGRYIMAGRRDEHALFVLHDRGRVLNVVDSDGNDHRSLVDRVDDPVALAKRLREGGGWDRVHVIERNHLAMVSREAQFAPQRELTLDAYYRRVASLVWSDNQGYACDPPRESHWNHWTYAGIEAYLDQLPSPSTLALGVFSDSGLKIGLVVRVDGGMIRQITTFEGVPLGGTAIDLTPDFARALWEGLATIASPAAMLLLREQTFTDWLEGEDKREIVAAAVAAGDAISREP